MKIRTLELAGIFTALHAMRNPLDSWDRSDSRQGLVGQKDRELSMKLAKAGTEHAKHLRFVTVYADITAPLYWWKQMDCYRVGVEKLSCSTMHTLMKRELTVDDFEHDCYPYIHLVTTIGDINSQMELYKQYENDPETRKTIWKGIIQMLPESFLQKRTVMMSYAALRNIYRQREGHRLSEWQWFCEWVESLPESWMITDKVRGADDEAD